MSWFCVAVVSVSAENESVEWNQDCHPRCLSADD